MHMQPGVPETSVGRSIALNLWTFGPFDNGRLPANTRKPLQEYLSHLSFSSNPKDPIIARTLHVAGVISDSIESQDSGRIQLFQHMHLLRPIAHVPDCSTRSRGGYDVVNLLCVPAPTMKYTKVSTPWR